MTAGGIKGDKTYNKPVNCPVCGMNLVRQPSLHQKIKYILPHLRYGIGANGWQCGRR
ncbi:heavy metal-binding domain-containing protein [Parafilimonas sp.]|uniref:heavy metal-binding domain-containing protein n=1 Tax=Parafilimonas sp. TaxID=1969739 RepID=UPI0039E6580B